MMIRHMVLLTLRDEFRPDAAEVQAALKASRDMAHQIPEAATWVVHHGVSERKGAADFVGCGDFDDRNAVQRFLAHPDHLHTASLWDVVSRAVVADIQIRRGN